MPSLRARIKKLGHKGYLSENDAIRIVDALDIADRYKEMCHNVRRIEEDNKESIINNVGFKYDESTKEFVIRKGDAEVRVADFKMVTDFLKDNKESNNT